MATSARKSTTRSSGERSRGAIQSSEEEIARLAYEKFEARGRVHGFAMEDWISAEAELRGTRAPARKGPGGA